MVSFSILWRIFLGNSTICVTDRWITGRFQYSLANLFGQFRLRFPILTGCFGYATAVNSLRTHSRKPISEKSWQIFDWKGTFSQINFCQKTGGDLRRLNYRAVRLSNRNQSQYNGQSPPVNSKTPFPLAVNLPAWIACPQISQGSRSSQASAW